MPQATDPTAVPLPEGGGKISPAAPTSASKSDFALPPLTHSARIVNGWALLAAPVQPVQAPGSGVSCRLPSTGLSADVGRKTRTDFPVLCAQVHRVPRESIVDALASHDLKDRLLANFDADVRAASSATTAESSRKTWCKFHVAWFGLDVPPIPLDPSKVCAIGACFKERSYKSFAPHSSKAKEEHILAQYDWSDL